MTDAPSVLLQGGWVIDGDAGTADVGDVRVAGGRIAEVGRLSPRPSERVYNLDGLCLAAGLIDTHTHTDCVTFMDPGLMPLAVANLRQGVTTQVCGNCGYSPFPIRDSSRAELVPHLLPALGPGTRTFPRLRAWREAIGDNPQPTNLAPLVGHGALRAGVMGFDDRAASESEMVQMESLLGESMQDGAFGLSSGLIYSPGMFAGTDELIRLAKVAADFGTPYATHLRNETDRVLPAVQEAIDIGIRSGAGVHISHHKVAGRANWGTTVETLALIDEARAGGLDVTVDVYPYTAGSTALQAVLPPWVQQGGTDVMLQRLGDAATRRRIGGELGDEGGAWQNLVRATGWDSIVIAAAAGHPTTEGRTVATLAEEAHRDPLDVACDLLVAERANVTIVLHMMDEPDVRNVLRWPRTMIGSDGILQPGQPHPRLAGTFAKILGKYVREEKLWPLPEAIRRMTSLPARRFKIPARGTVRQGAVADLVVFDPATAADRATYEDPLAPPAGIIHVMVNGVMAVEQGELTGQFAGRILSRKDADGF